MTVLVLVLAMFGLAPTSRGYPAPAEPKKAPEYLLKAAYLYKFLFFIQWPEEIQSAIQQDENFTIGILGKDPFGDSFKPIEGMVVKSLNKKIAVKRLGPYRKGLDLKQCRLLYICPSEKKNFKKILRRTQDGAILTIADTRGFVDLGGMINMVDKDGHIRWEINLEAIRRPGLSVSSALIQSAVRVIRDPEN